MPFAMTGEEKMLPPVGSEVQSATRRGTLVYVRRCSPCTTPVCCAFTPSIAVDGEMLELPEVVELFVCSSEGRSSANATPPAATTSTSSPAKTSSLPRERQSRGEGVSFGAEGRSG